MKDEYMKYDRTYPSSFACSICTKKIEREPSHNSWPFPGKHCCQRCNGEKIIPARIALHYMQAPELFADKDKPVVTPAEESK
jgi:hypothetical protein